MKTVTVSKQMLIDKLNANRIEHAGVYAQAINNWRNDLATEAEEIARLCRLGQDPNLGKLYRDNAKPENHDDDYAMSLGMLALHEPDTIQITAQEYQQLVMDNWDWKERWTTSNAKYLGR